MSVQATGLTWDVYVAPAEPTVTGGLTLGHTRRLWSQASATLIPGTRDAVRGLADRAAAHDRNLPPAYITYATAVRPEHHPRPPPRRTSVRPARGNEQMRHGSGRR